MEYFATTLAQETSVHEPELFRLTAHRRHGNMLVLGMRNEDHREVIKLQIAQDIAKGAGLAVIDTTGHYAKDALDLIPPHREHKTVYFKPEMRGRAIGFNPFRAVSDDDKALVSNRVVEAFIDIWGLDFERTPLLIDTVRNAARLVLDSQDGTFLTMYAALANDEFRKSLVEQCSDPMTRRIWEDIADLPRRDRQGMMQSTMTRLRAFLSDPLLQVTLGQPKAALDLDRIVNKNQIFLADLNRREMGAESARLLGSLLLTRLQTALSRRWSGIPFYVYVPAAQEVHVGIAGRLLAERFHHAGIICGVDQLDDLEPKQRANLLAAETVLSFRAGLNDVQHFTSRLLIPRPEDNVPALKENRFVVTECQRELTIPDLEEPQRFKKAKAIAKRSKRALGERRGLVERNIRKFIENY